MPEADLYVAWYCPFAQRAWIGALYRSLDVRIVEQDPKIKSPEWLAISPRGTVPAMIHNNKSIYESALLLEYLDDTWPDDSGRPVMASEPYIRFQARLWGAYIDSKLVKPLYQLLACKDHSEQEKLRSQLLVDLKHMFDQWTSETAFFLGDEPGYVDFMLFPFAIRYKTVLKELRNFEIPKAGFEKFEKWYDQVIKLECVKKTMPDMMKVVDAYRKFYEI